MGLLDFLKKKKRKKREEIAYWERISRKEVPHWVKKAELKWLKKNRGTGKSVKPLLGREITFDENKIIELDESDDRSVNMWSKVFRGKTYLYKIVYIAKEHWHGSAEEKYYKKSKKFEHLTS
jgi:hypothetical protein